MVTFPTLFLVSLLVTSCNQRIVYSALTTLRKILDNLQYLPPLIVIQAITSLNHHSA
jgi:hypothetical protein